MFARAVRLSLGVHSCAVAELGNLHKTVGGRCIDVVRTCFEYFIRFLVFFFGFSVKGIKLRQL